MEREERVEVVRRLFDAFSRRDADAATEFVDPDVELVVVTAGRTRGGEPYRGVDGLRAYFADVGKVWRELRVIPQEYRTRDDTVLALGRVYARDLEGSIVDSPAGWIWRVENGRVVFARVFERPEEAIAAFDEGEPG
jgi:ketosteroid isomerase-like protein